MIQFLRLPSRTVQCACVCLSLIIGLVVALQRSRTTCCLSGLLTPKNLGCPLCACTRIRCLPQVPHATLSLDLHPLACAVTPTSSVQRFSCAARAVSLHIWCRYSVACCNPKVPITPTVSGIWLVHDPCPFSSESFSSAQPRICASHETLLSMRVVSRNARTLSLFGHS